MPFESNLATDEAPIPPRSSIQSNSNSSTNVGKRSYTDYRNPQYLDEILGTASRIPQDEEYSLDTADADNAHSEDRGSRQYRHSRQQIQEPFLQTDDDDGSEPPRKRQASTLETVRGLWSRFRGEEKQCNIAKNRLRQMEMDLEEMDRRAKLCKTLGISGRDDHVLMVSQQSQVKDEILRLENIIAATEDQMDSLLGLTT